MVKDTFGLFPATTRQKGNDYFRSGHVDILATTPRGAAAAVHGSRLYTVSVEWRGKYVTGDCTCPAFSDYGPCKHLWATLLALDARHFLPKHAEFHDDAVGEALDDDVDDLEDADDGWLLDRAVPRAPRRGAAASSPSGKTKRPKASPPPQWQHALHVARAEMATAPKQPARDWPDDRRLVYILDLWNSALRQQIVIGLATERLGKNGAWKPPKGIGLTRDQLLANPDPLDREIAQMLIGATTTYAYDYRYTAQRAPAEVAVERGMIDVLLPRICATGRARVRRASYEEPTETATWDDGPPWIVSLALELSTDRKLYTLTGHLVRGEARVAIGDPHLLLETGVVVLGNVVGRYDHGGAFPLVRMLRTPPPIAGTVRELPAFLNELFSVPRLPRIDLPPELGITESRAAPAPIVAVHSEAHPWSAPRTVLALSFDYGGVVVPAGPGPSALYDHGSRRVVYRSADAEQRALDRLRALGARDVHLPYQTTTRIEIAPVKRDRLVAALLGDGWQVEIEQQQLRVARGVDAGVSSGIDWFDLSAEIDYGAASASLPELLAALRRGERTLPLADGSLGIISDEMVQRWQGLAALGRATGATVRFTRAQAGVLDALVAAMPEVRVDALFKSVRERLHRFERVEPAGAPPTFAGTLRPYQSTGLGWMDFLRDFGFGGCLADDMGLGKTVQVLALLDARRAQAAGPSLVVVPRSLVFNWREEARRFAPGLRVLEHGGAGRPRAGDHFREHDLIITTYGTLRRDAVDFKDLVFDYVILDEAQAIKNPATAAAKAARLLTAKHRLALTGTPIENRLADLWSIFEFLNPGMLSTATVFKQATAAAPANGGSDGRASLARGLRPFILRRTKEQVAPELPERLEQTLFLDLEPAERRLYDELRAHYRRSLLGKVTRDGIGRSKIHVLEALLRLRQAACHPGLVSAKHAAGTSSKLDVLVSRLAEVVSEGHKALVFSQFTTLLGFVRSRLDADGIAYEYLDGKTRDREAAVARFQDDPECRVFLISLKAGGLGLNLTAAEYVFLLDPWWNPAVEAQAIDRSHRIGQTRRVLATRLVARDTVEEKVLELQAMKRDLADAIITADNSLIQRMGREDLELLLS